MVPFAFSVHQIVSSVGADVGFAAIAGLAILVLLYFAQARETANLRDQTNAAGQRVEELEARISALVRRQAAPVAAPAPIAVARGPGAGAVGAGPQLPPAAPAGVGAPALAAATRLIPTMVPARLPPAVAPAQQPPAMAPAQQPPAMVPAEPSLAPAAAAQGETGGPTNGTGEVTIDPVPEAPVMYAASPVDFDESEQPGVRPATFAGAGNGAPGDRPFDAALAGSGAGRLADRPPVRHISPIPPRRQAPPPRSTSGSPVRMVGALILGAAIAAGAIIAVMHLTANSAPTRPPHAAATARSRATAVTVDPADVTVAVLNGTSINGLASQTATRLAALGYKQGTIADAAAQTYTASVVEYLPGQRVAALAVARALKLSSSAVQPIDSTTEAVACPTSPCTANVVVTAGANLASD